MIIFKLPSLKKQYTWRALGLPEGAHKTDVNKKFREVVNSFEVELEEMAVKAARPDSDIPVYEYLCEWLKR